MTEKILAYATPFPGLLRDDPRSTQHFQEMMWPRMLHDKPAQPFFNKFPAVALAPEALLCEVFPLDPKDGPAI